MGTLTIRIDDQLEADLNRLVAQAEHKTKSELAREMLRQSSILANFRQARKQLKPYAEKVGWLTDEDVFREIS
jgi:predicted transcriptional regulator